MSRGGVAMQNAFLDGFINFRNGLGQQCAPSKQFVADTEQELEPVEALLGNGWGVAVSDYEGYTTGSAPTRASGFRSSAKGSVRKARRPIRGIDMFDPAALF